MYFIIANTKKLITSFLQQILLLRLIVSHTFIYKTLRKFGFCNDFVRWVQERHKNIESCVLKDGFSTGYFALKRGTRQGDPLAPYLFILVLEVLGNLVKNNTIIEGIKILNFE